MALTLGCSSGFGPYTAPSDRYGYKDGTGPDQWAELSNAFAACADGQRQSPIDIISNRVAETSVGEVSIDYRGTSLNVRRDAHTLRLDIDPGSSIELDSIHYELKELHFHRISEHAIDGRQYPLEAHFIHESDEGKLAIIAALIQFGTPNMFLVKILQSTPAEPGAEAHYPDRLINFANFLSDRMPQLAEVKAGVRRGRAPEFYRYEGSLTVPPCTEGVRWLVMKQILSAHRVQQKGFRERIAGNYRPLQPQGERPVVRMQSSGAMP